MANKCSHVAQLPKGGVRPDSQGCEDCEKTGDTWVSVRVCQTCGHSGCCDSSKNMHARKHFHQTKHPIIKPFDGSWTWCYVDDDYV